MWNARLLLKSTKENQMITAFLIVGGTDEDRQFRKGELIRAQGILWAYRIFEQGDEIALLFCSGIREERDKIYADEMVFDEAKKLAGTKKLHGNDRPVELSSGIALMLNYSKTESGIIDASSHATKYGPMGGYAPGFWSEKRIDEFARDFERQYRGTDNHTKKGRCSVM